jgi:hypothetical protein
MIRWNKVELKKVLTMWNIVAALIIIAVTSFFLIFIFYPIIKNETLLLIFGIFYMLILSTSVWAAWASINIGYLPHKNSIITAIGLTCFYFCDISVIFDLAASSRGAISPDLGFTIAGYPGWQGIQFIVHNIIWMFYTPALLLVSLSEYKTKLICYLEPRKTSA